MKITHPTQKSLDETVTSWNLHKVQTAGNKTPLATYQLSREKAITQGYWTGDPGDDEDMASNPLYGYDFNERSPPADEVASDPEAPDLGEYEDLKAEREAGVFVNDDEEIWEAREILKDMDCSVDDGNSGIDIYCEAVLCITLYLSGNDDSDD